MSSKSGSYTPAKQDAAFTDMVYIPSQGAVHDEVEIKGPRAEIREGLQEFAAFTNSMSYKMLVLGVFKSKGCGKKIGYLLLLLLVLLASVLVPLYMIVEGLRGLNNCPVRPFIPKWLIILGAIVLFNSIVNFLILGFCDQQKVGLPKKIIQMGTYIAHLVLVILGGIWIFQITYILNDSSSKDCNYTTYRTAFAHLVIFLSFNAILILSLIIFIIYKVVRHARN